MIQIEKNTRVILATCKELQIPDEHLICINIYNTLSACYILLKIEYMYLYKKDRTIVNNTIEINNIKVRFV